jgi:hypothetical protein
VPSRAGVGKIGNLFYSVTVQKSGGWSPETVFLKLLRSQGIDSMESILSAYVAWRSGTTNLSYTVPSSHRLYQQFLILCTVQGVLRLLDEQKRELKENVYYCTRTNATS